MGVENPRPRLLRRPRHSPRTTLGLVAVVSVVVAVHLGLGGLLLASSGPWKHWIVGIVLAALLAKAVLVLRRRRPRASNTHL